jgi:Protein phosphatase 2C
VTGQAGGPWPFVAGASVQGRDHRAVGRENQDAFTARVCQDRAALVLAVSDGAGSQPRSALGSHIAVDAAVRVLANDMPGADDTADRWQSWLNEAARAIVDDYLRVTATAGPASVPEATDELAATLVAAVVCPPWAGFVSVGDSFGAILTAGPPERCQLVMPPRSDPGGTDFVSSPWAKDMLHCLVVCDPQLSGVMLATDGCAAMALDHPAVLGLDPASGPQPSAAFFVGLATAIRAGGGNSEPIHKMLTGESAARCPDDLTVLCALAP